MAGHHPPMKFVDWPSFHCTWWQRPHLVSAPACINEKQLSPNTIQCQFLKEGIVKPATSRPTSEVSVHVWGWNIARPKLDSESCHQIKKKKKEKPRKASKTTHIKKPIIKFSSLPLPFHPSHVYVQVHHFTGWNQQKAYSYHWTADFKRLYSALNFWSEFHSFPTLGP